MPRKLDGTGTRTECPRRIHTAPINSQFRVTNAKSAAISVNQFLDVRLRKGRGKSNAATVCERLGFVVLALSSVCGTAGTNPGCRHCDSFFRFARKVGAIPGISLAANSLLPAS